MKRTYTLENIHKAAGKELTDKMLAVIDDKDDLIQFFYSPNYFFHGKSPYELCKKGETSKLEKAIMDILTAAQGG